MKRMFFRNRNMALALGVTLGMGFVMAAMVSGAAPYLRNHVMFRNVVLLLAYLCCVYAGVVVVSLMYPEKPFMAERLSGIILFTGLLVSLLRGGYEFNIFYVLAKVCFTVAGTYLGISSAHYIISNQKGGLFFAWVSRGEDNTAQGE